MPIQKTEIDKAPYIAYADKPGMIYDGSGGGGGADIGVLVYVSDGSGSLYFGLAYIKIGDSILYDSWLDAPYADDFQNGHNLAMGITIVLRAGDSSDMSQYKLNSVLYGENGSESSQVDESLLDWDEEEQTFTITIPFFEATNPGLVFNYEYNPE